MHEISVRLKSAREECCKSPEEVAIEVGIGLPAYYDLEAGYDWATAVSIATISRIAKAVGLTFAELMCGHVRRDMSPLLETDLQDQLKRVVANSGLEIHAFEDEIGWAIGPFLNDSKAAGTWNVDCLRTVCERVGVDWCTFSPEQETLKKR
jgi:transcriptional regulator with XRE-family HTH domain